MILGLGIDITEIRRMERAMQTGAFLSRVFTDAERSYAEEHGNRAETYAGLFSAKEATAKALGTGFSDFGLHDVEIVHDAAGKPAALLHRAAAARMSALGGTKLHVSITHAAGVAAAEVILED